MCSINSLLVNSLSQYRLTVHTVIPRVIVPLQLVSQKFETNFFSSENNTIWGNFMRGIDCACSRCLKTIVNLSKINFIDKHLILSLEFSVIERACDSCYKCGPKEGRWDKNDISSACSAKCCTFSFLLYFFVQTVHPCVIVF